MRIYIIKSKFDWPLAPFNIAYLMPKRTLAPHSASNLFLYYCQHAHKNKKKNIPTQKNM